MLIYSGFIMIPPPKYKLSMNFPRVRMNLLDVGSQLSPHVSLLKIFSAGASQGNVDVIFHSFEVDDSLSTAFVAKPQLHGKCLNV